MAMDRGEEHRCRCRQLRFGQGGRRALGKILLCAHVEPPLVCRGNAADSWEMWIGALPFQFNVAGTLIEFSDRASQPANRSIGSPDRVCRSAVTSLGAFHTELETASVSCGGNGYALILSAAVVCIEGS